MGSRKQNISLIPIILLIAVSSLLHNSAAKEEVDERSSAKQDETSMNEGFYSNTGPADQQWGLSSSYLPPSYYMDYLNSENPGLAKRNFNPWGGKRSRLSDYYLRLSKGGFNPWGGKRDTSRSTKNEYPGSRRLPFNPWGGR